MESQTIRKVLRSYWQDLTHDKIVFWILFSGLLLLPLFPLFVWTGGALTLQLVKQNFFLFFLFAALVFYFGQILSRRQLILSFHHLWLVSGVLVVGTIISALLSGGFWFSFFGSGWETDTALMIIAFLLLFYLVSQTFTTADRVMNFFVAFSMIGGLVLLWQIGWLSWLSLDRLFPALVKDGPPAGALNLIGRWNSLGWFSGFILLLVTLWLDLFSWRGAPRFRLVLFILWILAAFFTALAGFYLIWPVLAGISLGSYLLIVFLMRTAENRMWLVRPLLGLLILSLFFSILGTNGSPLVQTIAAAQHILKSETIEVRPSLFSTFLLARSAGNSSFIFGTGPAQFFSAWAWYKPPAVNLDPQFWALDFDLGLSWLLSFLVTGGLVGTAAWLIWLLGLGFEAGRSLRRGGESDEGKRRLLILIWLCALYLWLAALVYTPDLTLLVLAFAVSGLGFGLELARREEKQLKFDWTVSRPRTQIILIVAIIGLVLSISGGVWTIGRVWAAGRIDAAVKLAARGDWDGATALVSQALVLDDQAAYQRYQAGINLTRLQILALQRAQRRDNDLSAETTTEALRNVLDQVINNAQRVVKSNGRDYRNYQTAAQVYETAALLSVRGASEKAKQAYAEAAKLAPANPVVPYLQARLAEGLGEHETARRYLQESLRIKPNFWEALFLLAQIENQAGRLEAAINQAEAAARISPAEPAAYFLLGVLKYTARDYQAAVAALKRAIELSPGQINANAQYFLGLSYRDLAEKEKARAEFEQLLKTNPDNQELQRLVKELSVSK